MKKIIIKNLTFLKGSVTLSLASLGSFATKLCLFILMLSPATAHAQVVTWTSSHPSIVSVDATGTIKLIREPATTTNVIITQTTTQNGKTVTSTKRVIADPYCSTNTQHGSCCKFNNITYCAVELPNGDIWMDRDIGATGIGAIGDRFNSDSINDSHCPPGWRMPTADEFRDMIRFVSGVSSLQHNSSACTISQAMVEHKPPLYITFITPEWGEYVIPKTLFSFGGHTARCHLTFNRGYIPGLSKYYPARCVKK